MKLQSLRPMLWVNDVEKTIEYYRRSSAISPIAILNLLINGAM